MAAVHQRLAHADPARLGRTNRRLISATRGGSSGFSAMQPST